MKFLETRKANIREHDTGVIIDGQFYWCNYGEHNDLITRYIDDHDDIEDPDKFILESCLLMAQFMLYDCGYQGLLGMKHCENNIKFLLQNEWLISDNPLLLEKLRKKD